LLETLTKALWCGMPFWCLGWWWLNLALLPHDLLKLIHNWWTLFNILCKHLSSWAKREKEIEEEEEKEIKDEPSIVQLITKEKKVEPSMIQMLTNEKKVEPSIVQSLTEENFSEDIISGVTISSPSISFSFSAQEDIILGVTISTPSISFSFLAQEDIISVEKFLILSLLFWFKVIWKENELLIIPWEHIDLLLQLVFL